MNRALNDSNIRFFASVNHLPLQLYGQIYTSAESANFWSSEVIVELCALVDAVSGVVDPNWAAPYYITNLNEVTGLAAVFDSSAGKFNNP